ncbi:MAG: phosphate signaling complex protein PhoU [Actinomycetota bacterium]|nr:phosphate signaling complex protein PhoU [Actinomycetota bacterium]
MDDNHLATAQHTEIRHRFEEQLDTIRSGLVEMASLVLENTRRAGEVATENRLDLIDAVRQADDPIDALYTELESLTFNILARQQPVATDLRFLVAATRMLYELERSGDLAVNIVNRAAAHNGFPQIPAIHSLLTRLIEESTKMFAQAVEALETFDPEIGANAEDSDDVVDNVTTRFFGTVHAHSAEIGLESAIELTHVGRFLERIADHGVNVAQNVTYVVTGTFPDGELADPPE